MERHTCKEFLDAYLFQPSPRFQAESSGRVLVLHGNGGRRCWVHELGIQQSLIKTLKGKNGLWWCIWDYR